MRFIRRFFLLIIVVSLAAMGTVFAVPKEGDVMEEAAALSDVPVDWASLERDPSRWLFDCFVFPEGMLTHLSTKALVQSLCEYPYLIGLSGLSNDFENDYVEAFAESSELVQELSSRADKIEWIMPVREKVILQAENGEGGIHSGVLLQLLDRTLR